MNDTITLDFITSATTGAATDADSLPTAEVFEDATDVSILSPTIAKRTGKTGSYRASVACTTGNGFEEGKSYNVVASATVGGVVAKSVIGCFQIGTNVSRWAGGIVIATPTGRVVGSNATTTEITTDLAYAEDVVKGKMLVFNDPGNTRLFFAAGVVQSYDVNTHRLTLSPALPSAPHADDTFCLNPVQAGSSGSTADDIWAHPDRTLTAERGRIIRN